MWKIWERVSSLLKESLNHCHQISQSEITVVFNKRSIHHNILQENTKFHHSYSEGLFTKRIKRTYSINLAKRLRGNSPSLRPALTLQILQANLAKQQIIPQFFPLQPELKYLHPQRLPQLGYNNELVHPNASVDQTDLRSIHDDNILIYHSREIIFSVIYIEFSNEFKKQQ